jgi:hypothetical protein
MAKAFKDLTSADVVTEQLKQKHKRIAYVSNQVKSMTFSDYIEKRFYYFKSVVEGQDDDATRALVEKQRDSTPKDWIQDIVGVIQRLDDILKTEKKVATKKIEVTGIDVPSSTSLDSFTEESELPLIPVISEPVVEEYLPPPSSEEDFSLPPIPIEVTYPEPTSSYIFTETPQFTSSIDSDDLVAQLIASHEILNQQLRDREKPAPLIVPSSLLEQVQSFIDLTGASGDHILSSLTSGLFRVENDMLAQFTKPSFIESSWHHDFKMISHLLSRLTLQTVSEGVTKNTLHLATTVLSAAYLINQETPRFAVPVLSNLPNTATLTKDMGRALQLLEVIMQMSEYTGKTHVELCAFVYSLLEHVSVWLVSFVKTGCYAIKTNDNIALFSMENGRSELSQDAEIKGNFDVARKQERLLQSLLKNPVEKPLNARYVMSASNIAEVPALVLSPLLRVGLNLKDSRDMLPIISIFAAPNIKRIIEKCPHLIGSSKVVLRACLAGYVTYSINMLADSVEQDTPDLARVLDVAETQRAAADSPSLDGYYSKDIVKAAAEILADTKDVTHTAKEILKAVSEQIIDPAAVLRIYLEIGSSVLSMSGISGHPFAPGDKNSYKNTAITFLFDSMMESLAEQIQNLKAVQGMIGLIDPAMRPEAQRVFADASPLYYVKDPTKPLDTAFYEQIRYLSENVSGLAYALSSSQFTPDSITKIATSGKSMAEYLSDKQLALIASSQGYGAYAASLETVRTSTWGIDKRIVSMLSSYVSWKNSSKTPIVHPLPVLLGPESGENVSRGIVAWLGYDARTLLYKFDRTQPASPTNRNFAIDYAIMQIDPPKKYDVEWVDYDTIVNNVKDVEDQVIQAFGSRKISVRRALERALGPMWHANSLLWVKSDELKGSLLVICALLCSIPENGGMAGMNELLKKLESVGSLKLQIEKLKEISEAMEKGKIIAGVDTSNVGPKNPVRCTAPFVPFYQEPVNIVMRTAEKRLLEYHERMISAVEGFGEKGHNMISVELRIASKMVLQQLAKYETVGKGKNVPGTPEEKAEAIAKDLIAMPMKDLCTDDFRLLQMVYTRPDSLSTTGLVKESVHQICSAIGNLISAITMVGLAAAKGKITVTVSGKDYIIDHIAMSLGTIYDSISSIFTIGYVGASSDITKALQEKVKGDDQITEIANLKDGEDTLPLDIGEINMNAIMIPDDDKSRNAEFRRTIYSLNTGSSYRGMVAKKINKLAGELILVHGIADTIDNQSDFVLEGITHTKTSADYLNNLTLYVLESLESISNQITKSLELDQTGAPSPIISDISKELSDRRGQILSAMDKVDFKNLLSYKEMYFAIMNPYSTNEAWQSLPPHIKKNYVIEESAATKWKISPASEKKGLQSNSECKAKKEETSSPSEAVASSPSQTRKDNADDAPRVWAQPMIKKKFAGFAPVTVP